MDPNEMRSQAQFIWNRLDDLAATDPDAYKKFIDEQMKEREIFNSAPEPQICVLVKIKGTNPVPLFLNICGWKRIPYPKDDQEPLKLLSGFKHQQQGMSQQHKLELEEKFEICKDLYKGDLPANPKRLFEKNPDYEFTESSIKELLHGGEQNLSSPEDLLKKLSTEDTDPNLIKNLTETNKKKPLVEEVISNSAETSLKQPDYTLTDDKQDYVVLNIKLPLVKSAAECDLNITPDSVELTVPSLYELTLALTDKIDDCRASAKFNKKSSTLTLKMPKMKVLKRNFPIT